MEKPDYPGGVFKAGDRVFYTENGPDDTGTVKHLNVTRGGKTPRIEYAVEWDNGDPKDYYGAGQLTAA